MYIHTHIHTYVTLREPIYNIERYSLKNKNRLYFDSRFSLDSKNTVHFLLHGLFKKKKATVPSGINLFTQNGFYNIAILCVTGIRNELERRMQFPEGAAVDSRASGDPEGSQ